LLGFFRKKLTEASSPLPASGKPADHGWFCRGHKTPLEKADFLKYGTLINGK
jgi:hypothetical protein